MTHSYDRRAKALRFDVVPGVPHETYGGIISLDGRFSHRLTVSGSPLLHRLTVRRVTEPSAW